MRKVIIGVMGPGNGAKTLDLNSAFELGKLIARKGWLLLSGGRNEGVMEAVNKGAKLAKGLTIGIIAGSDNEHTSEDVDIAIVTDLGSARNNINALTSDIVIACGMSTGTASEVTLALKAGKNVVLLNNDQKAKTFFKNLDKEHVFIAENPRKAIQIAQKLIG